MIMREMFRCVWMDNGDMSVIMTGQVIMKLEQSVNSWATPLHVRNSIDNVTIYFPQLCILSVLMYRNRRKNKFLFWLWQRNYLDGLCELQMGFQ